MIKIIKTIDLLSKREMLIAFVFSIIFSILAGVLARHVAQIYDPNFKLVHFLYISFSTYLFFVCLFFVTMFFWVMVTIFAFKFFKPSAEVLVSWFKGIPVIEAKGVFYNKKQYIFIIFSPLFIIDIAIYVMFLLGLVTAYSFAFIFILNTAVCSGAIYTASLLILQPKNISIRDEGMKIKIFLPDLDNL